MSTFFFHQIFATFQCHGEMFMIGPVLNVLETGIGCTIEVLTFLNIYSKKIGFRSGDNKNRPKVCLFDCCMYNSTFTNIATAGRDWSFGSNPVSRQTFLLFFIFFS